MPRRLLLISARVGSAGYSHSDHYVALQNLQLADFALITQFRLQLPTSTQTFTHPLKLSGTDSYTAILLPPPLPPPPTPPYNQPLCSYIYPKDFPNFSQGLHIESRWCVAQAGAL